MVVRSNALKGYIYRQKGTPNPIKNSQYYVEGQMYEPTEELLFRYYPSKGKTSDPRAYVNGLGQDLVDLLWLVSSNTSNPTKKLREFGTHGFRDQASMIKQFNDFSYCRIYAVPEGIVSNGWQNMSDDDWRKDYRAGKNPEHKHVFFNDAWTYSDWKNDEVFRGRIIDDPKTKENDPSINWVESEKDIPKGKEYMDFPKNRVGRYDAQSLEKGMRDVIRNAAPPKSRKYTVTAPYTNILNERQLKEIGITPEDMKIGDWRYYEGKGGMKYNVRRSESVKSRKFSKRKVR